MSEDVRAHCKRCQICRERKGATGYTTWSRVELSERPFRVLQIDSVGRIKPHGDVSGARFVLTVVDLFSRYIWMIPLRDNDSKSVACALIDRVFCDLGVIPIVIRSDRGSEFSGHVIEYLDKAFGIKHVYGSAYHPQSQAIVERSHRNMSDLLAILSRASPRHWESLLPRVCFGLRSLPRKSLGGRSPLEVVTGLRPQFPNSLSLGTLPAALTQDEYCKRLITSMLSVHAEIHKIQLSDLEAHEYNAARGVGGEFHVGDLCLVRRPKVVSSVENRQAPVRQGAEALADAEPIVEVEGERVHVSRRLLPRTYPRVYRIKAVISPSTYQLEDAVSPDAALPFAQTQNVTRLVRIEESWMHNPFSEGQCTNLEVLSEDGVTWRACKAVEMSMEGKVGIRWNDLPEKVVFLDLTQHKYRFVM